MSKPVTYAALKKMLEEHGFKEAVVPGSHIVFTHPEPNMLLMYRVYKPNEVVSPTDVGVTRWFLDAWGLVKADSFEQLLQETAA